MTDLSASSLVELESLRTALPVPLATVRWVADLDQPGLGPVVLLAPYAIANEHVGLHAVLVDRPLPDYTSAEAVTRSIADAEVRVHLSDDPGGIAASWAAGHPVFVVTWDGRDPDGRRATMRCLAELLGPALTGDLPPRLIVSADADWTLLSDAIGWELPLRASHHDPVVETFAVHAHWWVERRKMPGQQAVVVLSEHIRASWQVPLEPDDRLHLGATLACFGPEAGDPDALLAAVRAAEQQPAGPRSMPHWDNDVFLEALAAIGRPPDRAAWEHAARLLWDHVEHRRAHLHRGMRLVYGDPQLPAAPSVAATGVASRPGLVDLEREAWTGREGFIDRRQEVVASYIGYQAAYRDLGADHPAVDMARRDAQSTRQRRMPRHLWRSRFDEMSHLTSALDTRRIIEDGVARADARRRGIALTGRIISAPPPSASPPQLESGKWSSSFTFNATIAVDGQRPLGRFREGSETSFGTVGVTDVDDLRGCDATVTAVDHPNRTITVAYRKTATSARGPDRIKVPPSPFALGSGIELLPSCRFATLHDQSFFAGARPATHVRPPGGGRIVLAPAGIAPRAVPDDLR
jgi:hypothetical protein